MSEPVISVENLNIAFRTDEGLVTAVDGVSFELAPGEVLGLVGESGSGKSVSAKALMQLNADNTVSFVGPYNPVTFRFGGYRKGVKPSDIEGFDTNIEPIPTHRFCKSVCSRSPI